MNRPRAADDFATIRARMEDLRREREGGGCRRRFAAGSTDARRPNPTLTAVEIGAGPGRTAASRETKDKLAPKVRGLLFVVG